MRNGNIERQVRSPAMDMNSPAWPTSRSHNGSPVTFTPALVWCTRSKTRLFDCQPHYEHRLVIRTRKSRPDEEIKSDLSLYYHAGNASTPKNAV